MPDLYLIYFTETRVSRLTRSIVRVGNERQGLKTVVRSVSVLDTVTKNWDQVINVVRYVGLESPISISVPVRRMNEVVNERNYELNESLICNVICVLKFT